MNNPKSNPMKYQLHLLLALLAVLILSACGGHKGVRITQGSQPAGTTATGTTDARAKASIVHVNLSSRLATMRNGYKFDKGDFLIVKNREGQQTGILKALAKRPIGLRTADILEGEPDINNTVVPASASEAARLAQLYRDSEE
jgi:hypothetical protein